MPVAHIWGSEGTLWVCVFNRWVRTDWFRHVTIGICHNKHIRVWGRFGAVLCVQLRIHTPITSPGGRCAQMVGLWGSYWYRFLDSKGRASCWITFATCLYTLRKMWGLGRRFRQIVGVLYQFLLLYRAAKLDKNEDSAGFSDQRNAQDGQKKPPFTAPTTDKAEVDTSSIDLVLMCYWVRD